MHLVLLPQCDNQMPAHRACMAQAHLWKDPENRRDLASTPQERSRAVI